MRNKIKLIGIIAVVAVIVFSMVGCSDGGGGGTRTPPPTTTTYTVTFNSNGGSSVAPIRLSSGSTISEPVVPVKGYAFVGWYKESALTNLWNFSTDTLTTNITLYAKWGDYDGSLDVGNTGPGGGKIFYKNDTGFTVQGHPSYNGGANYTAHYLEAAPANAVGGTGSDTTMRWTTATSFPGVPTIPGLVDIPSTGEYSWEIQLDVLNADIGMGRRNTALIVQYEDNTSTYIYAAKAASNYTNSGYSDWFLPSIGELYWLYQNETLLDTWSSSQ